MADWGEYRYRVVATDLVTPVIRELWLDPLDEPLPYLPGQYVLLGDTDFRVPQRSFSIANAPRPDGRLSILVTLVDGGATSQWAHGIRVYDEVLVEGPFGTFVLGPGLTDPVLLCGAGSGLAPVRALAEALLASNDESPTKRLVTLAFSGRTAADAIDRDKFEELAADRDDFDYFLTLTRDATAPRHTRLPSLLPDIATDMTGWEVFASGPSGFVTGCATAAQALGAAPSQVRTEEFFTDPQPWSGTMPPITGSAAKTQGSQ